MAFASVVLLLSLLAVPAVFGADHTVGGTSGWAQGVDYTTWASGQKFVVGDNLVFNYGSSHSVDEVRQSDYSSCSSSNPINSYSGGQTTVALTKSGSVYFICSTLGHCGNGMKLSVTVAAASTPTPTPSTPTPTTPSTPTPTTPSTPTPTTPSTPSTPPNEDTPPASPDSPPTPTESPSGAVGGFGNMNKLVVGVCIVFAGLVGLMG